MKWCPISRCEEIHADEKVMCRKHWLMTPSSLRTDVWRAVHQWVSAKDDRNRYEKMRALQRRAIEEVNAIVAAEARRRS